MNPEHPQPDPIFVALDPQIVFERREIGSRTTYIAHQSELGKYFHLGAEEYHVASLLDGNRSIGEIVAQLHGDGIDWNEEDVAEFVGKLVGSQLASAVGAQSAPRHSAEDGWLGSTLKLLPLVISQRIPLFNGHQIASRLERRLGPAFSRTGVVFWIGLVCSALMIVGFHRDAFAEELARLFDPAIWLVLLVMWIGCKLVHEMGHAVAARYHGVRVGKVGVLFFFCAPLAFVDVTDAWKLRNRWSRVQIALAGVYFELIVASAAAWAWWMLPTGYVRHLSAQLFLVAGPATLLVNANPLLRLDGYYVASDLTEIPNLRMHGRAQLGGLIEKLLLRMTPQRPLLSGWRRSFATAHAAASVVFQIVWMSGLVIGVSMWARGLGLVLAVAAIMLWVIVPLFRWIIKVWTLEPGGRWFLNPTRHRLIACATILSSAIQFLSTSDSPFARRVPVVVEFRDEQIARATADAFVRNVYVTRGQRVSAGMLLVELDDPELLLERLQRADEIKIAELRAVQFRRQGELAKSAGETESAQSMRRQLAELDAQIEGLSVFAERDGLVVSLGVDDLEGRFVKEGVELLRVSDPQDKELLVLVSERDMQAYQIAAQRSAPAQVRLRGGTKFTAVPSVLRPRARRNLPHPALAATAGGPLAVEATPDSDEAMRTVEPQLQSRTPIDPATSVEVHAGQLGAMTIADNRSLTSRLIDSVWH